MSHWSYEVINHELEDGQYFFFGVAGELGECCVLVVISQPSSHATEKTYPLRMVQDITSEIHSGSSDMALFVMQESMIHKTDFHEVLSKGSGLNVVVVGFRDTSQEVHRVWEAQIILESRQGISFGAQDFINGEAVVGDVNEVANMWREDFLVLGCDEHGGDTDELQFVQRDDFLGQESVHDVDG
jgi:hypothetical protein